MLLFYLLYAASNPIDRICNKEAFYSANTTMTSEQSKQYRLMNGKLLFSGDFHVDTNWQIMLAIQISKYCYYTINHKKVSIVYKWPDQKVSPPQY